jgi:hypothetical protein
MGCDKRKGKELVVESPKKKKTHTQKEVERAAMVARATDDQATDRGRRFQIREPGARTKEQQGERVSSPPHRSLHERPRTRGGHTERQDPSLRQQETRPHHSRATAQDHVEDRGAATVVYRMDTTVRVSEGTQLHDLTKAKAAKVKRLRWAVLMEEWRLQPRDSTVDSRFWTILQASFYESYHRRGHKLFPNRVLDWVSVSQQAGGADIESHFTHFRGLPGLLEVGQNRYVEDWVRVFYSTVRVGQERSVIWFMFGGQPYRLTRAQLVEILGVDLVDVSLHAAVYGDADQPHRALVAGIAPTHEEISILFHQPFPVFLPACTRSSYR